MININEDSLQQCYNCGNCRSLDKKLKITLDNTLSTEISLPECIINQKYMTCVHGDCKYHKPRI